MALAKGDPAINIIPAARRRSTPYFSMAIHVISFCMRMRLNQWARPSPARDLTPATPAQPVWFSQSWACLHQSKIGGVFASYVRPIEYHPRTQIHMALPSSRGKPRCKGCGFHRSKMKALENLSRCLSFFCFLLLLPNPARRSAPCRVWHPHAHC